MIDVTIEVDTKQTDAALKSLPEKIAKKVLRQGAFAGAKLIRDRVKSATPIRREGTRGKYYGRMGNSLIRYPGLLKRMIGAKYNKKVSSKWDVRYNVKPIGPAFYGFFVEGGHRVGKRPSRSRIRMGMDKRGQVPAHPFMAPVFRNAANEAIARMKTVIEQGAMKEWASTGFQGFARP